MAITMIGIDHNKASVDIRSLFSFTKKNSVTAMEHLKKDPGVLGCIILSTCNRLEIWANVDEEWEGSLYEFLCREKQVNADEYEAYFIRRDGKDAVCHLFYLASGLKSQILAEDQIITQVKDALALSRDAYCTDGILEVLFRTAVTAAKRVKTEVVFSRGNSSVINQVISRLEGQGYDLQGKTCMVIGNGEMGKVAALALREAGAAVTVTVRQYRSGMVVIPPGCERINYGDRMSFMSQCDMVVSATASPNYTLTRELMEEAKITERVILVDLAVPRDIEPDLASMPNVTLYDIDSFKIETRSPELQASMEQAGVILREEMDEFYNWMCGRNVIPRIREISTEAVEDLNGRIKKAVNKAQMNEKEKEELLKIIDTAAGKVVSKLIFGLRDFLEADAFLECVEGLEKIYEE